MEPSARPPAIRDGAFHAYFVYDVADTVDVTRLSRVAGEGVAPAPLQLRKEASASSIEFGTQPLIARLAAGADGTRWRAKIYDYGVVSVRLSLPFSGAWDDFAALGRRMRADAALGTLAREHLDAVLKDISPALDEPHAPLLEDYTIFEVRAFEEDVAGTDLIGRCGNALAGLILGEERTLTAQERDETLRVNFSYFEDDLTVVQWDAAFVYDRAEGAQAVADILEFANTQLVELRTYDAILDAELDAIYKLQPGRRDRIPRGGAVAAADRLRYVSVDVTEITDRVSNALKIIGDAYYARLYRGAAGRLGLRDWQRRIDSKLQSASEMYRFLTDQAQAARSQFIEIVIVALILLELVVGILALRH